MAELEGLLSCDLDLAPQLDALLQDPLLGEGVPPHEDPLRGSPPGWGSPESDDGGAYNFRSPAQSCVERETPERGASEGCSGMTMAAESSLVTPNGGEFYVQSAWLLYGRGSGDGMGWGG